MWPNCICDATDMGRELPRRLSSRSDCKSWAFACYEAFLISRLLGSFLTIEFAFKRPDFRLNFFGHFHIRSH